MLHITSASNNVLLWSTFEVLLRTQTKTPGYSFWGLKSGTPDPPCGTSSSTSRVSLSRLSILIPSVSTRQLRFLSKLLPPGVLELGSALPIWERITSSSVVRLLVEISSVHSICEFTRVVFLGLRVCLTRFLQRTWSNSRPSTSV